MKKSIEYKRFPGLYVCCKVCGKNVFHKQSREKSCSHPIEKQFYKVQIKIPNMGGKRTSKNLKAKTYDEAVIEFLDFKHKVYNPHLYEEDTKQEKPKYLTDAIAMYVDYLHDVDIPHHQKKHLSDTHIKVYVQFLTEFVRFLMENNYSSNIENLKLISITEMIVGDYCIYIEEKGNSNYTFNSKIKTLRAFYNYLISVKEYSIKNVWKDVKLKAERPTDISINPDDFYSLLDIISPEKSRTQIGKTKRNMYRPWLKDVIMLKAYTGRRNSELFAMKWNMIKYEDNRPMYIMSPNNKLNQLQNNTRDEDIQYAYIPIGEELLGLLMKLGLKDNRNSNSYIIAPEDPNRKSMEKYTSKYFTFFFKKLNRNYTIQFKHLRQTYITAEDMFLRRGVSLQHADYRTTSKHYIDRKEIVKEMVKNGFRVFPSHSQRTLTKDAVPIKKDLAKPQGLDYQGGEYRNRTDDLLTASQSDKPFISF